MVHRKRYDNSFCIFWAFTLLKIYVEQVGDICRSGNRFLFSVKQKGKKKNSCTSLPSPFYYVNNWEEIPHNIYIGQR